MFLTLKQTSAWRFARGAKRVLLAPRVDGILPAEQCRSAVSWLNPPASVEAGCTFAARVKLENRSGVAWAAGNKPVSIRCQWETFDGKAFNDAMQVVPLSSAVFPGEPQELTIPLKAPKFVGDFVAVIDFVQDGVAFADRNADSVAARVCIPVQGLRAADIDYNEVFRTANLQENHWWVVGAYHSKEQFEKSSKDRLGMLQKYGLTPNTRLLDVGCGTGQMAGALQPFLSDNGAYYGTDIGKEAIDFCQRTYHRRNFVFRHGGMTTLPFTAADGAFDMAIFFSVFTHTFIDETALLLSETLKRMKPDGCIIADVITSPLVERGAGNRGEMIVNREYFFRIAAMLNLTGEIIGRWDWNKHAERIMVRFRRSETR